MSHVPTMLKSDRSVFEKLLPVDDNGEHFNHFKDVLVWGRFALWSFCLVHRRQIGQFHCAIKSKSSLSRYCWTFVVLIN